MMGLKGIIKGRQILNRWQAWTDFPARKKSSAIGVCYNVLIYNVLGIDSPS